MKKVKTAKSGKNATKIDIKFKIPTADFEKYVALATEQKISVRKYIVKLLSQKIDNKS